jgi:hypothetical protein
VGGSFDDDGVGVADVLVLDVLVLDGIGLDRLGAGWFVTGGCGVVGGTGNAGVHNGSDEWPNDGGVFGTCPPVTADVDGGGGVVLLGVRAEGVVDIPIVPVTAAAVPVRASAAAAPARTRCARRRRRKAPDDGGAARAVNAAT